MILENKNIHSHQLPTLKIIRVNEPKGLINAKLRNKSGEFEFTPTLLPKNSRIHDHSDILFGTLSKTETLLQIKKLSECKDVNFNRLQKEILQLEDTDLFLRTLWNETQSQRQPSQLFINNLISHLVLTIGDRISEVAPKAQKLSLKQLCSVIQFMAENLRDNIHLDSLSQIAGVSTFHFSRLFKNTIGEPPAKHLRRLRVERAEFLLTDNENISLVDIALQCGFYDQSHFTRVFKSVAGMTPLKYQIETSRSTTSTVI